MAARGKRGPGNFAGRVVEEAKKEGMTVVRETPGAPVEEYFLPPAAEAGPAQENLKIDVPAQPLAVRNGRMYANFNEPLYTLDKNENRMVGLALSFSLTPEHKGRLPKKIERGWEFLKEQNDKRLDIKGVGTHTVEFFLSPEDIEPLLSLKGAVIERISLVEVEETGKGKAWTSIRLSFVVRTHAGPSVDPFATQSYGAAFWINLFEPQGRLR